MGILDGLKNLFKAEVNEKVVQPVPTHIRFGRYSDNNKTLAKTNKWFEADRLYDEKKIDESIIATFDYLRDEKEDNVILQQDGENYTFKIFQGTKIVYGTINKDEVRAAVSLAEMQQNSVPVMRRLLEMNYSLLYTRYALQENKLCMIFDTPKDMASPSKLYYGLKELATKADKQDDLLVTDFTSLKSVDDSHVEKFGENEIEVKYNYFKKWIDETLARIETVNQDSFSGGIGYLLLTLIYRIDFLIMPEGKLLNELESINNLYWSNKEEKTSVERNQILKEAFKKIQAWPKEEVLRYFYRAKSTFAITMPKPMADIEDSIKSANENTAWYLENNYKDFGLQVMEYGLAYCQYSYSLPKPLTQLFTLYMQINYTDFFKDLGFSLNYRNGENLQVQSIKNRIQEIIQEDKERYPKLQIQLDKLKFSFVEEFNLSFLQEIASLNFEAK